MMVGLSGKCLSFSVHKLELDVNVICVSHGCPGLFQVAAVTENDHQTNNYSRGGGSVNEDKYEERQEGQGELRRGAEQGEERVEANEDHYEEIITPPSYVFQSFLREAK